MCAQLHVLEEALQRSRVAPPECAPLPWRGVAGTAAPACFGVVSSSEGWAEGQGALAGASLCRPWVPETGLGLGLGLGNGAHTDHAENTEACAQHTRADPAARFGRWAQHVAAKQRDAAEWQEWHNMTDAPLLPVNARDSRQKWVLPGVVPPMHQHWHRPAVMQAEVPRHRCDLLAPVEWV